MKRVGEFAEVTRVLATAITRGSKLDSIKRAVLLY